MHANGLAAAQPVRRSSGHCILHQVHAGPGAAALDPGWFCKAVRTMRLLPSIPTPPDMYQAHYLTGALGSATPNATLWVHHSRSQTGISTHACRHITPTPTLRIPELAVDTTLPTHHSGRQNCSVTQPCLYTTQASRLAARCMRHPHTTQAARLAVRCTHATHPLAPRPPAC